MLITIRGATTSNNSRDEILRDTEELLRKMLSENGAAIDDVVLCIFTCTEDLDEVYPAVAARALGLTEASLLCLQEMRVKNGLEKCIRAMIQFESDKKQSAARHVYLKGAAGLRPDLRSG